MTAVPESISRKISMSNIKTRLKGIAALSAVAVFTGQLIFAQDETEYKKFKLEDASCDVGIRYIKTQKGMTVGVSAIATGKGAEFRKWKVSDIKLRIGGSRFRPDRSGKFYVTEESLFRVPGAIAIAALAAVGDYSGSSFENTVSRLGVALGMGLIALQAKGEIGGERCMFYIPEETAEKIEEGRDSIDIIVENEDQHLKDEIKIGLLKNVGDPAKKYNFEQMDTDELSNRMDNLKNEIIALEQEQSVYKYGRDPEYDAIQKKIEKAETERGIAYKIWFEKQDGRNKI